MVSAEPMCLISKSLRVSSDGWFLQYVVFAGEVVKESLYCIDMLRADGLLIIIDGQCNLYVYFGMPQQKGEKSENRTNLF